MQRQHSISATLLILILMSCSSDNNPILNIMKSNSPQIRAIYSSLEKHEVQIIYTQIERDESGIPKFTDFQFQADDRQYFYPASTAKLPVAILALQKVRELQKNGIPISVQSRFVAKESSTGKIIIDRDSSSETGYPTLAHMIRKIFLVSDNDAYNYLFDFLGRDYINQELNLRGIGPLHINHKFLQEANNKHTWEYEFFDENDQPIYHQPSIESNVDKHSYPLFGMKKGVGFIDNNGNLINEPFDFSGKNYLSLQSLNRILKAVIFPESFPQNERFDITTEDHDFLRYWMSRNTLESDYPNYQTDNYYESYVKFFMFGDTHDPMPDNIRIYNKVGNAYGTLSEVAYIVDEDNDVEFMLSATLLINQNQVFNDGVYEYEELGFPFMAELGRKVYQLELQRKR